jgi:uncharacterized protein YecT (DUF1311 family)
MRSWLAVFFLIATFLVRNGAALGEVTPSNGPDRGVHVQPDCMNTARTQFELTTCAEGLFAAADKLLNKSYEAVLPYLCPDERAQLLASERAWIAFRDADCAFWGTGGGSISPMNAALCRESLSRERAKELDGWPPNSPRDAVVTGCPNKR